jgi:uncharacterized membrane protein
VETHYRSIIKALSWRAIATIITCLVALTLTGSLELAAQIGIFDTVVKIGVFYFHERMWNRLDFGKRKPPEYNI